MSIQLGNIVGKIGGNSSSGVETTTVNIGLSGDSDVLLRTVTVKRRSFVAVLAETDFALTIINAPTPSIDIYSQDGTQHCYMAMTSSSERLEHPFSCAAVLEPGTYQILANTRSSRRSFTVTTLTTCIQEV